MYGIIRHDARSEVRVDQVRPLTGTNNFLRPHQVFIVIFSLTMSTRARHRYGTRGKRLRTGCKSIQITIIFTVFTHSIDEEPTVFAPEARLSVEIYIGLICIVTNCYTVSEISLYGDAIFFFFSSTCHQHTPMAIPTEVFIVFAIP